MPHWVEVILLGLVEGITEFLPVSSTGHLLLVERWLGIANDDLFVTVIQCGAVLAVLMVFWSRLQALGREWRNPISQQYLLKLAVAFFITGVGGLLLKKAGFKLPEKAAPVAWATLIGGVLILLIERALRGKPLKDEITWPVAVLVGFAQLLAAVFPGTSRSGATILMALAFGAARPRATEFSFLLGVPTLLAAGALQIYSARKHGESIDWGTVLLGMGVSAVTAFATVKWLLRFVQTHTFIAFGWYRIVLGGLILLLLR